MIRNVLNIIILLALALMTGLSIFGAFLGSQRAGAIAGSGFFVVLGIILLLVFAGSFLRFPILLARPGLLMIHIGCMAVLLGGIWGGKWSHSMRMEDMPESSVGLVRYGKLYKSLLKIDKGDFASGLRYDDEQGGVNVCPLDYKIYLSDFTLEHYPNGQVSDYVSQVMIIGKSGQHFGPYEIEVNKPLYFGGYHFYQHGYDQQSGSFTILRVVSDDGLWLVYAGYFLLLSGICWHLWLEPALKYYQRSEVAIDA